MRTAGATLLYFFAALLSIPFVLVLGLAVYNVVGTGYYGQDLVVAGFLFVMTALIAGAIYGLHRVAQGLLGRK